LYGGLHQRLRYFPSQAVEELQQALDLLSGGQYRAASAAFEAIMRAPGPPALLQKARRGCEQAGKGVALSMLSPEELLRMLPVRCARGCVGARRDLGVGRIAALQHVSPTSYLSKVMGASTSDATVPPNPRGIPAAGSRCTRTSASCRRSTPARLGLGRIVALYHRSSISYQIH
jgi:hypothetical protein